MQLSKIFSVCKTRENVNFVNPFQSAKTWRNLMRQFSLRIVISIQTLNPNRIQVKNKYWKYYHPQKKTLPMLPNMSQLLLLWLPGKGEIPSSLPAVAPCMPCSLVKHPPLPLSPIPLAKGERWGHALVPCSAWHRSGRSTDAFQSIPEKMSSQRS